MLLPYETTMNLFMTAVPIYEWEPQTPEAAPMADAGAAVPGAECDSEAGNALPPPLRLVFKGMRWVAVPVWGMRENPAWEQVAQNRRDEDEQNSLERSRRGRGVSDAAGSTATPTPPEVGNED